MIHILFRTLMTLVSICFASSMLWAVADEPASPALDVEVDVEVLADNLEHPWSLAFLPDGRLLVTERPGRLRIVETGQVSEPVANVPPVYAESQGGLLDVVLHPDYASNGWLYLTFAHGSANANATRLIRAKLTGNALTDIDVLFTATPFKDTPVHYGGRLAFLEESTLILTLGDGFDYREEAQRLDNHFGKLIRLHDDGSIPEDNPFVDGKDTLPEIWSYGHRNPQAIVVDPANGIVYAHEHGPAGGDEINIIKRGHNYGWPIATHGRDYSGAAITPYTEFHGTDNPLVDWTPSIAPAGMAFVDSDQFAEWQGNLLVSALKSRDLRRVSFEVNGTVQESLLGDRGARLRDVRIGPDGDVYVLTDSQAGQILRVSRHTE